MSLSRAALRAARPRALVLSQSSRRLASSSVHEHHDEHHHDEHHDSTQYPKEGFTSRGWTYSIVAALGIVGFYKFAPTAGEDNFLTRYIAFYYTPVEEWATRNAKHLQLSSELSEAQHVIQGACRPPVRRYRYPQKFELASPFSVPVGTDVDLSDLKVKSDKDW
ncbi:hypothetical protein OF83DRAFT_1163084 [Amylostereum chailletii]|nr:hypothetical protein OF83DRAFT_1163084 [Amylostereum chailletii]